MIRYKITGKSKSNYIAVVVCDICGKQIESVDKGIAIYRESRLGHEQFVNLLHVHKGECDEAGNKKLMGSDRESAPSDELADHIIEIAGGLGFTIRRMINKEVEWTAALTPPKNAFLQATIGKLEDWLIANDVHSRLWEGPDEDQDLDDEES